MHCKRERASPAHHLNKGTFEMLKFKTATPSVADLELDLGAAKTNLDQAREVYRERRLHLEDCKALYAESDTIERRADLDAAYEASRQATDAVTAATSGVKAAERLLDLARTGPQRAATAKRLRTPSDELEAAIRDLEKPLARVTAAMDGASFVEILAFSAEAQRFAHAAYGLSEAIRLGDGRQYVAALRNLADRVVAGEADCGLSEPIAEQRRKAG